MTTPQPHPHTGPVGPDTLITVKVIIDGTNRRFRLALRDLGAHTLPNKLRFLLAVPPEADVKFDRYSDSAGAYVTLDSNNPAIYKQLYRAAKAKLKLRLRATVTHPVKMEESQPPEAVLPESVKTEEAGEAPQPAPPTKLWTNKIKPEYQDSFARVFEKMAAAKQEESKNNFLETVLSQPLTTGSVTSFKSFQKTCPYSAPKIPGAFDANAPLYEPTPAVKPPQDNRAEVYSLPTLPSLQDFAINTFSIDCNNCNKSVPDEHFHCSICEKGDFDLCRACVDAGVSCGGDDHWLIKRSIRNGTIVPSTTETLPPKNMSKPQEVQAPLENHEEEDFGRTCNNCISGLPSSEFVTCLDCTDFDLCLDCFRGAEHGHHPQHTFEPQAKDHKLIDAKIQAMCAPGRGVRHDAICDGCDKSIHGVRHKCFSCPDFDYCSTCILNAGTAHPGHRFAAIYEPLKFVRAAKPYHLGIYCDGPLCSSHKRYITGIRYKCAVCHDTDFCENCEALPANGHNPTHPLVKIKIPFRHISIATFEENESGQNLAMGDRPAAKHAATETTRPTSSNAATQVQTVADIKPAENVALKTEAPTSTPPAGNSSSTISPNDLQGEYLSDSLNDGTKVEPNHLISQSWTIRNPGPETWPAGCAVYYIGGDDMRNLDADHPSSVSSMARANRSNVLETPLEPNQEAVFTVMVKSPKREGRAISYWRLKTPSGLPFGHKLWVDIIVREARAELPIRAAVPVIVDAPTEKDDVGVDAKAEEDSEKSQDSGSTMIFPTLEKESPVSSIHESSAAAEAPVALMKPSSTTAEPELDDVESLELEESDSDDEEFLTDEEYDILDASDEDFLEAQHANSK